MAQSYDLVVVGGGAAGIFGALSALEHAPQARVCVLEKSSRFLSKVKISGGGRCNVTHACFEPRELVKHYPRGSRELIGAFHRWQPRDMVDWLNAHGVELKTEPDGRMFPVTDDSRTIMDCLLNTLRRQGAELRTRAGVRSLRYLEEQGVFELSLAGEVLHARSVLLACGGAGGHALAESLGHTISSCVPSLFTFNIEDPRLEGLAGLSVQKARVGLDLKHAYEGPCLITHWGLSGPAVLRCSAWEARRLHERGYAFEVFVDWMGGRGDLRQRFDYLRKEASRKSVWNSGIEGIPARLWQRLVESAGISESVTWAQISKKAMQDLEAQLCESKFKVRGKSTHKDEFVTCGGIALNEVDFKRFSSRLREGLFFAGEMLDIDGITGGFNFQAAWTGGRLAGEAIASYIEGI